MRIVGVWIVAWSLVYGAHTYARLWPAGQTLPQYLRHNHIPTSLLPQLPPQTQKAVAKIRAGQRYYELREREELVQALIPLDATRQIHLRRRCGTYRLTIIPIATRRIDDTVSFAIRDGLRQQIERHTHHPRLAYWLGRLFRGVVSLRTLQPQDRLVFRYTQDAYLGRPIGTPTLRAALLETHGKRYFVHVDPDGTIHHGVRKAVTYTQTQKRPHTYTTTRQVKDPVFRMPLDHVRITSRFSLRRWHPILHKYRPHYGVDFGARSGTPLKAVNDGTVIYAGWMRGYGKVVKIDHGAGFVSLYAHQSKIAVRRNQHVKRGQIIGRVGSTGRSTGPHLHFGLYRHGKPIDPLRYLNRKGTGLTHTVTETHTVMKTYTVRKTRWVEIPGARRLQKKLAAQLEHDTTANHQWLREETDGASSTQEARHG